MWRARIGKVARATRMAVAMWLAVTGVGGGAASASDPAEESEKLVRHGIELRRRRDDGAAVRDFQEAYRLYPSPRAAAQLGLAKQALGLWDEAERYVAEALRAGSDPWVSKNRGVLDEALGTIQKHLGRIEVIGDPEGAEVAMNGRRVGKLPLGEPARVSEGAVDVELRAQGYVSAQRTVTVSAGQYQRVVFHLAKVAPTATPAAAIATTVPANVDAGRTGRAEMNVAASGKAPEPAVTSTASAPTSPSVDTSSTGNRRGLEWTAAGLAIGGLATGIVGTALHSSNVDKFNAHPCRNNQGMGVRPDGTPDEECQSILDTFRMDRTIAIVGFAAAGALTAAWLALVLTEPPPATGSLEQAARWPRCAPDLTRPGLSCAARF